MQDVHERFRTESHSEATGRFNERFLLSLASCQSCVVMDDELNILPISSHMKSIKPVSVEEVSCSLLQTNTVLVPKTIVQFFSVFYDNPWHLYCKMFPVLLDTVKGCHVYLLLIVKMYTLQISEECHNG